MSHLLIVTDDDRVELPLPIAETRHLAVPILSSHLSQDPDMPKVERDVPRSRIFTIGSNP